MSTNERAKTRARESLASIQAQIEKMDNKASILLAVVGLIFSAVTGLLVDVLKSVVGCWFVAIILSYGCAVICAGAILISLISVIKPRENEENKKATSLYYYMDVAKMDDDEIKAKLEESDEDEVSSLEEQLKINAKICTDKSRNLNRAIIEIKMFLIFMMVSTVFALSSYWYINL